MLLTRPRSAIYRHEKAAPVDVLGSFPENCPTASRLAMTKIVVHSFLMRANSVLMSESTPEANSFVY